LKYALLDALYAAGGFSERCWGMLAVRARMFVANLAANPDN
jgi:hypothetical protein